MEKLHALNISLHVMAGTIGLLAGLAALCVRKTTEAHRRFGRVFMWAMIVIVVTGLYGVLAYGRNYFLLVITLLSGYNCFSGIRVLRLRGQRPQVIDQLAALLVLACGAYYVYFIMASGQYWAPVITYATVGALAVVAGYDLCRMMLPQRFLARSIYYEHAYKMVGAFSGITSAFTGTVLPQYKPYSQFLPSVLGIGITVFIFILLSSKHISCTPSSKHS